MTLANKITMARLVITPVFFLLFQLVTQQLFHIARYLQITILLTLLLLFAISELSDLFDGLVARRLKQISGIGKLMDPFSDIISRVTYFFCFYQLNIMPTYAFILILWREISMLFLRQLVQLSGHGPLAARWPGKVKAIIYFITTSLGLLLFLFTHWPDSPYFQITAIIDKSQLENICVFTLDSLYYLNIWTTIYTLLNAWLLPLSFFISVLISWYSFMVYLRDFLPILRKLL